MKYRIQEECCGTRLNYDDRFDTIEEALEVVREYQDQDEEDEERNDVLYIVVNEKGEDVFRVEYGYKYVVRIPNHPISTKTASVSIDDLFEEKSIMLGAFDTLEEAEALYSTLPAGEAWEVKTFNGGSIYLHTGKFIEFCCFNDRGEFVEGSDVPEYDVPDYEEKE